MQLGAPYFARGTPLTEKNLLRCAFSVQCLQDAGINMVSLANNHIMDYGQEALIDTLNILAEHNIAAAGAGTDSTQAHASTIMERKGYRVALLAYTDDFAVPAQHRSFWRAAEQKPGAALLHDHNQIKADIERLRPAADLVLVSFHWGYEYTSNVAAEQQKTWPSGNRRRCRSGTGTPSPCTAGIEIYRGKPIVLQV